MTADPGRLAGYSTAATALALLSDRRLAALVDQAPVVATGIGGTAVALEVDGVPVFAKRVPLTDLERRPEHARSTANMFDLPTFTHYGLGSAGGGVWRELAAHVMTTNWVLDGRCAGFPLLYHWRVLDGGPAAPVQPAELDQQVAYWNGSPAVRARLQAIADASACVVLCCERLPHTLHDWLTGQVAAGTIDAAATLVERELLATVDAMNANGLLHFDTHSGNVLTDGRHVYLTDFGLATSPRFDLSPAEHAFVREHDAHDACYVRASLVNWLVTALTGRLDRADRLAFVSRCADDPRHPELATLPPAVAALIRRHAPVAAAVGHFYADLHLRSRTTPYPADPLRQLLLAAEVT